MFIEKIKNTPICSFVSVFIIIIFLLYLTNIIKTIPCEKKMSSIFISNFIHTDFLHLFSNLYGIYALSRVENKIGLKKFTILLILLLIFNTLFETILHKLIKQPCSIGFSGVLYGIMTFEIIYTKKIDYVLFIAILIDIFMSKYTNKKNSLSGHFIGIISGIIISILIKKYY